MRFKAALLDDVVERELLVGNADVARCGLQLRAITPQVAAEPSERRASAENTMIHDDLRIVGGDIAGIVEGDPGIVKRMKRGDLHARSFCSENTESNADEPCALLGRIKGYLDGDMGILRRDDVDGDDVGAPVFPVDADKRAARLSSTSRNDDRIIGGLRDEVVAGRTQAGLEGKTGVVGKLVENRFALIGRKRRGIEVARLGLAAGSAHNGTRIASRTASIEYSLERSDLAFEQAGFSQERRPVELYTERGGVPPVFRKRDLLVVHRKTMPGFCGQ